MTITISVAFYLKIAENRAERKNAVKRDKYIQNQEKELKKYVKCEIFRYFYTLIRIVFHMLVCYNWDKKKTERGKNDKNKRRHYWHGLYRRKPY